MTKLIGSGTSGKKTLSSFFPSPPSPLHYFSTEEWGSGCPSSECAVPGPAAPSCPARSAGEQRREPSRDSTPCFHLSPFSDVSEVLCPSVC